MKKVTMSPLEFMEWYESNKERIEIVLEPKWESINKKCGVEPIIIDGDLFFKNKDVDMIEHLGVYVSGITIENIEFLENEIVVNYKDKSFLPRDIFGLLVKSSPLDFLGGEK